MHQFNRRYRASTCLLAVWLVTPTYRNLWASVQPVFSVIRFAVSGQLHRCSNFHYVGLTGALKSFCSPSGQLHRRLDLILPNHPVSAIIGWTDAVSISTSEQPVLASLCCRLCSSVEPTLFKYVRRINRWVISCCVLRCFFAYASALVHALFLGVFSVGVTPHSYSTRHLGLEGLGVHFGLVQVASSGEIFIWLPFTPLWSPFRSLMY